MNTGDDDGTAAGNAPDASMRAPVSIPAMADAYVRQLFPDENHGSEPIVRTGSGSELGRANPISIAGCDVVAAGSLVKP